MLLCGAWRGKKGQGRGGAAGCGWSGGYCASFSFSIKWVLVGWRGGSDLSDTSSPSLRSESQYSKLPSADKKKWAGSPNEKKKNRIVRKRWHIDCLVCASKDWVSEVSPPYICRRRDAVHSAAVKGNDRLKCHFRLETPSLNQSSTI